MFAAPCGARLTPRWRAEGATSARGRNSRLSVSARTPGRPPKVVEPDVPQRREWPFPKFIEATLAKFPDAGVCDVEEARVLEEEGGYMFLDVRSKPEYEYRIFPSVHVPIVNAVFRFDTALKRKVPQQTINAQFVQQVEATVPDKATKIIVTCSDGRVRTLSALRALDEAGYTNLVGMRGGYNGFSRVFDGKFWRRVEPDAMREVAYSSDFQDQTTGIFGTGASYDRVDSVQWVPVKDPETWLVWEEEMEKHSA